MKVKEKASYGQSIFVVASLLRNIKPLHSISFVRSFERSNQNQANMNRSKISYSVRTPNVQPGADQRHFPRDALQIQPEIGNVAHRANRAPKRQTPQVMLQLHPRKGLAERLRKTTSKD